MCQKLQGAAQSMWHRFLKESILGKGVSALLLKIPE